MKKILILSGPNLNMLGRREPELYGSLTLADIEAKCLEIGEANKLAIDFRQSNHEGELIGWIQEGMGAIDGLIINAGAYTHTSIAIHDALKLLSVPIIEVHITDPHSREPFRHISYIEPLATSVVKGRGPQGYWEALDYFISQG